MPFRHSCHCLLLLGALATPVMAQTGGSRAGEIAKEQEAKAADLVPPRQIWIEQELIRIEEGGGFDVARGFFVAAGDIKSGSGFALGAGYLKMFGDDGLFTLKGVYSIRNFKLLHASAEKPLARGKVVIGGRARWHDAPELAVFPLGTDSPDTRADYAETMTEASGRATIFPAGPFRLGIGLGFESFDTEAADTSRPPVDEVFTPETLPGLGADPDYLHTVASAAINTGGGYSYSRSGSLLEATWHDYRQQNDGSFSFQRVDGAARQLIPILSGNWVIDLSARASTTMQSDDNQVPYFLMPDLGGGSDLRGYGNYRFRDRHSVIFTAEYRWYVQEFVDMAIFYDAGKVTPRRKDLDFSDLKSDIGFGIRFHGPRTTVLRAELAKSEEGLRLILAFSAPGR